MNNEHWHYIIAYRLMVAELLVTHIVKSQTHPLIMVVCFKLDKSVMVCGLCIECQLPLHHFLFVHDWEIENLIILHTCVFVCVSVCMCRLLGSLLYKVMQ